MAFRSTHPSSESSFDNELKYLYENDGLSGIVEKKTHKVTDSNCNDLDVSYETVDERRHLSLHLGDATPSMGQQPTTHHCN